MKNPVWFDEMMERYRMGVNNFFILTGNVEDYVDPQIKLISYLQRKLNEQNFKINTVAPHVGYTDRGNSFRLYDEELTSIGYDLTKDGKRAVIMSYADLIVPKRENMSTERMIDLIRMSEYLKSPSFMHSENILILITDNYMELNKMITSASIKSHIIEIPYPNEDSRLEFIQFLDKTSDKKIKKEISNEDFSKITAGLTLSGIEDIYLISEAHGVLKKSYVKDRKNELIRAEYGDVIEIFDTDDYDFTMFAGQDELKNYHKEVVINPMVEGRTDIVPKGLLYTGPPGTGKTHFAKCLSGEAGINFVEFKVSKIMEKWVGSSERNFERAINCFKSITPVGVFIDEIDQAFTRGEDNTGVRNAIFGMFLSVLSDSETRGKIIWIGATNYPNRLDEAMKRTGRFDKKMPFLPPELEDRIETFNIHINRLSPNNSILESDLVFLGDLTEGYTQAEIEGIVLKAVELKSRRIKNSLTMDEINDAMKFIVKASSKNIDEMVNIAINECNDLEFLPKKYWHLKKEG